MPVRAVHVLKWTSPTDKTNLFSLVFLQVMRYPERVNKKHVQKKKSVRMCSFKPEDDEKPGVDGDGVAQTVSELVNEKAFGSLQTQHFEDVVCQLAQLCLVHVNEKNSERHLVFLSLLLRSFHTTKVFSVSYILHLQFRMNCLCFNIK